MNPEVVKNTFIIIGAMIFIYGTATFLADTKAKGTVWQRLANAYLKAFLFLVAMFFVAWILGFCDSRGPIEDCGYQDCQERSFPNF